MHMLAFAVHAAAALAQALADPSPSPTPTKVTIDSGKVVANLSKIVVPLLGFILGATVLSWSRRGKMAESANSTLVFVLGLIIIAGSTLWYLAGDWLLNLLVSVG